MNTTQTKTDWLEDNAAKLIAAAKRSEWKRDIFADAEYFRAQGYVGDVALAMACKYWLG